MSRVPFHGRINQRNYEENAQMKKSNPDKTNLFFSLERNTNKTMGAIKHSYSGINSVYKLLLGCRQSIMLLDS